MSDVPILSRVFLLRPRRVLDHLDQLRASGRHAAVPTPWQLSLGVLRMWVRLVTRPETIGTSAAAVRPTLRARVLAWRPLRFPFLVAERAIAPLDFSGLSSSTARIIKHLLGAHHDGTQALYDLEILASRPGALEELRAALAEIVERDTPRSRWLQDLTVFEGYHAHLLALVDDARAGRFDYDADDARDPDVSFSAYLAWCAAQPPTPAATLASLRAGALDLGDTRI